MSERLPRKLAAILYADVADYSRLTGEDEDSTHRTLGEYLDLITTTVDSHRGEVMHYAGDAVLARFQAVVDAVSSATDIQTQLAALNEGLPDEREVRLRIGVHLGDVIEDRGDIYGDGVNIAARLESLAHPGGICVSEAVRSAVKTSLDLLYEDMGEQVLKNIAERIRAFRLVDSDRPRAATVSQAPSALPDKPSIAVLPFANMSTDPENEFFSDGITEEIINALVQVDALHVASRTSSFYFKGKTLEMREIAERLRVTTLLEGSVRRAGTRVRITAQLIDVAKDEHLWSERFDREIEDIFAIQDEIARTIADRLKVSLEDGADTPLVKPHTENLEAYQLYLKGRSILYKRGLVIPRGLECFNQALALDPDYALAHAGLADGNTMLGYYGFAPGKETMPQAKKAATQALELAPDLAEAHNAFAIVSLLHDRDWQTAERAFRRALELNPQYVQARSWYGLFYLQFVAGRFEEGLAELRRCVEIDPLCGYNAAVLGVGLGLAGYHEEAIEQAVKATELDPDAYHTRWILQVVYGWASRYQEAEQAGEEALAISGRHPWAMAILAATYGNWGKPEKASAIYEELKARTGREYIQPSMLAVAALSAGLLDEGVALFSRAYEQREPFLTIVARLWPEFAPLREDPRGQEIIVKMEFP